MRRIITRGALVAVSLMLWSATIACVADGGIDHPVVGEWGARTQSGELVPAFSFKDDGTFEILDSSGTGLPATDGGYIVLDKSSVQWLPADRGFTRVIFEVDRATLTVRAGDNAYYGFKRLENE